MVPWYPDFDKEGGYTFINPGEDYVWEHKFNHDFVSLQGNLANTNTDVLFPNASVVGWQTKNDIKNVHYNYPSTTDGRLVNDSIQLKNYYIPNWKDVTQNLKPLICQVPFMPNLEGPGGKVNHKIYFYAQYECSITFEYGQRGSQYQFNYSTAAPTIDNKLLVNQNVITVNEERLEAATRRHGYNNHNKRVRLRNFVVAMNPLLNTI
eukprot:Awhi_evm1s13057